MQTFGNLCLTLAGILYLFPLQHLLLEVARKRDDGGGAIAGILILGPMWLLLLVGMILATAQGGFDGLPLRRPLLHALVIAGTIALAVLTFVSFTAHFRTPWATRLTLGLPVYVVPLLTIALVAAVLNPGWGTRVPVAVLRVPWLVVAGLSLAGGVGYLSLGAARRVTRTVTQIVHTAGQDQEVDASVRARLPSLDPERDFSELLNHAAHAGSPEIRALATSRLRTSPQFIDQLTDALGQSDPSPAITFAAEADLSEDERRRLAAPLHRAMQGFGEYIQDRLTYFPKDWLKRVRAWGRSTYPVVAAKFAGTGPDFASLSAAFDHAFASGTR